MAIDMTPRQEDAQRRIHELLAELTEIIGPGDDGQAEYEPGEGPSGKTVLWEYAVACCWVDDDRKSFLTVVPYAGMLNHHTVGLLNQAALEYGGIGP